MCFSYLNRKKNWCLVSTVKFVNMGVSKLSKFSSKLDLRIKHDLGLLKRLVQYQSKYSYRCNTINATEV